MSQDSLCRTKGSGPSRLLVSLLLLLGVLAMHGLPMDHDAPGGAPPSSMSMTSEPVGTLTPSVLAVPASAVQAYVSSTAAPPELSAGMMSMLGGMCLAALLAAGIRLLVRRARSTEREPRWLSTPLRHRSLGLLPGHDPPGSLLLRLCVMRT